MQNLNNLITSPVFIKQFADLYLERKSESQWQAMTRNAQPYIVKARNKFRGFFYQQLDECVKYLNNQKSIKILSADDAINWEQWNIQFEEFGQLLLTDIISQWGPEILGTITAGISFDVDFPYIQDFIKEHSFKMAINVNETTKERLRELFTRAITAGDSVPQIEKQLKVMFADVGKIRANMIARSEVIRAHNAGAESAYIESGVVQYKQWWTSKGERRTCRFCNALHGKIIIVGMNYFSLGDRYELINEAGKKEILKINYSDIRYPPLHVRCRCCLLPVI
jgi:SPP1 gp7 family putative phage head morphogenesis protein